MIQSKFPIQQQIPILELGPDFYDEVIPAKFPNGIYRYKNMSALQKLGFAQMSDKDLQKHFWEFSPLETNLNKPLALRYHGHQFTTYNPELGDGRGFLFSQHLVEGKLYALGTKGSGTTPYSRRGDGRLTLKGAVREALATEMLESLGVNTSRTFTVFETGEQLDRNDEPSPTRSAVLVRMNHSHIRFGTFQRLAYLKQDENIKKLISYCIKYYFPEIKNVNDPQLQAEIFFQLVTTRSADLVASVMMAGFVHGVLNTDNMNITGELFDYGPYRFMPEYNPNFIAAYFDHQGLYSFGRQPFTFAWNLEQLGKSLMMAFPEMGIKTPLENFGEDFNSAIQKYFLLRLNIQFCDADAKVSELLSLFFELMESHKLLFEQSFFDFHSGWDDTRLQNSPQKNKYLHEDFKKLKSLFQQTQKLRDTSKWDSYLRSGQPETLIIEEIESLWASIDKENNWKPFNDKIERLRQIRGLFKF